MEAIRTIQTVENGQICLQLPEQFWGQEVEIVVLRTQESAQAQETSGSLYPRAASTPSSGSSS
ncbi:MULTISPECIES: hypothetical protein [Thiorhodovibrio]|uniref:hypothetical protein n=1 Tax=Thiorhodovibrio TaxID=61593 RepID=UPI001913D01C|nr:MULTISPECIES: hypothetical protein [Thiorhodovibrio]WPL13189.1 hypothetical protein Thiosp_02983 [Thiorhodovibrio litoralis]